MSTLDMTAVLLHSKAVGTSKLVLMGIAYHTGKDSLNGCWPSQALLAEYTNTSTRQVRRALDHLVELGEVIVHSRGSWSKGSAAQTNVYYLADLCPDSCDKTINHRLSVRTFKVVGADIYGT